jgi:hypothetical protein
VNGPESPHLSSLILTHIVQTEVKSKMSALKQRLQREPAFPDGPPSEVGPSWRRARYPPRRATSVQKVARVMLAGDCPVRSAKTASESRVNDLMSWALWHFAGTGTHLQQAYSKRGQPAQQAHQAVNTLPLPFFEAASAFEALMIVLDQPTVPLPVHALPGLFERRGGHRGQQKPFPCFLTFWSLLLPHTDDPNGEGIFACSWLIARGQEGHLINGHLDLGRTCFVPLSSGNVQRTALLARPRAGASQSLVDLFLAALYAP